MEAGAVGELVWLHAEPHDLKISTAVILSEAQSSGAVSVCVQPQECGVTITNSSNLAAAKAVLLAWLGVGQGRVKKSGYVNSKWCLPELLFGWISATVFQNTVGSRKGNPIISYPSHPQS